MWCGNRAKSGENEDQKKQGMDIGGEAGFYADPIASHSYPITHF